MRQRDEKKIQALTDAAFALIQADGISQLSISKLAKRAGVSVATAYIYFENKADLLGRLYQQARHELIETIPEANTLLPVEAQFSAVLHAYARRFIDAPHLVRFITELGNNPAYLPEAMQQDQSLVSPAFMAVIRQAYQQDRLRGDNLDLIVAQGLQPLQWLIQTRIQHGVPVKDAEVDQLIEMASLAIFTS